MSAELNQDKQTTASLDSARETEVKKPLEAVVADVKRDSRKSSQRYLDETKVPHGGE
jgi:hypothetical protein